MLRRHGGAEALHRGGGHGHGPAAAEALHAAKAETKSRPSGLRKRARGDEYAFLDTEARMQLAALIPGEGHGTTFSVAEDTRPALIMVPDDPSQGWKRGLRLPAYVLDAQPPPRQLNLNRYLPISDDERAPVLPELFMPGFPKSSTTWLYKCMGAVWRPESKAIGCGDDPAGWSAARCPKRFLLASISTNGVGENRERKETFFFGGTPVKFWDNDFLEMHGPDPRSGANARLPALYAWWPSRLRLRAEARPELARLGQEYAAANRGSTRWPPDVMRRAQTETDRSLRLAHMRRLGAMCQTPRFSRTCELARWADAARAPLRSDGGLGNVTAAALAKARLNCPPKARNAPRCSTYGVGRLRGRHPIIPGSGPNTCSHPGCERIAHGLPASWSAPCGWTMDLHEKYNLTDTYCVRSVTPWASAKELNLSVVDFTPNYLCDAEAVQRIHSSTTEPGRLRFIIAMRDPVMRAFSEWSMFALGWHWDQKGNFTEAMEVKLQGLRTCNRTIYDDPTMLPTLPTAELGAYIQACFRQGKAMMYPQLSMYAPCILHALRYFSREQFLFLRYEDLMRMDAAAIVRLVGRFTGLHVDDALVREAVSEGKCAPYVDPRAEAKREAATATRMAKLGRVVPKAAAAKPSKPMSFSGTSEDAAEYLTGPTGTALERFFDPYNKMLADAIGPEFRWRRADHWKKALNATERELHTAKRRAGEVARMLAKERHQLAQLNLAKTANAWAKGQRGKGKGRGRLLAARLRLRR